MVFMNARYVGPPTMGTALGELLPTVQQNPIAEVGLDEAVVASLVMVGPTGLEPMTSTV